MAVLVVVVERERGEGSSEEERPRHHHPTRQSAEQGCRLEGGRREKRESER